MKKNWIKRYFVEITVTNSCNCNCKYCFETNHCDTSNKNEEQLQLQKIIELCEKLKNKDIQLNLTFWGGEPMMNTNFLFLIIENTYKYDFVYYQMYTNGTLYENFNKMIQQSWFNFIKDRFHIQVSYDGEPHNSLMRGYDGEKIFKTFDLLLESGIKSDLKATLSLDKLKLLPEIWMSYYNLFKKYDFISYSPTLDTTNNNIEYLNDWETSLKEIITYELNFLKKYQRPLWYWFREHEKISCLNSNRFHIHNDGNIYLCHGCPYLKNNEKFILGNTQNNNLIDLFFENDETEKNAECENCDATYCSVCHINNIAENIKTITEVSNEWVKCRHLDKNKCKYYKIFGKYSRILKMAFRKG